MSDQFFYLQFRFTPKVGHTFTDEREVFVEVPKQLVQRKLASVNESLKVVIALDLAKTAAFYTFPTEAERVLDLYDEHPPFWYPDRPPIMDERPCDHEENGIRTWRVKGPSTEMVGKDRHLKKRPVYDEQPCAQYR